MSAAPASPQHRRESACPVHVIWDGRGAGRWPVRMAFWAACASGLLVSGARMVRVPVPQDAWDGFVTGVCVLYAAGLALSLLPLRRPLQAPPPAAD